MEAIYKSADLLNIKAPVTPSVVSHHDSNVHVYSNSHISQ